MSDALSHVLLDIEGTTCPVHFVSETLFPYAASHLGPFLMARQGDAAVQELVSQVERAWAEDPDPAAQALRMAGSLPGSSSASAPASAPGGSAPGSGSTHSPTSAGCVLPYLQWLIQQDRKLTPLKELQGLVWEEGYQRGELKGPLYPDVPPALRRWRASGLGLAVYSSGSVKAQQLIYGHSTDGDLRPLFQHWFDTRIGAKLEASSYVRIVRQLGAPPQRVLFISDSVGELRAAHAAGLVVLLSDRRDIPTTSPAGSGGFAQVSSFEDLNPHQWP